jgi:hypothetical protein
MGLASWGSRVPRALLSGKVRFTRMHQSKRYFQGFSWLGLIGLSVLAGCGGTPSSDEAPIGGGVSPTTAPIAEGADDVACNLISVPELIQLQVEKVGQNALVFVTNDAKEEAHVALKADVITDLGLETFENIAVVDVPAGKTVEVELAQGELGLGAGEQDAQLVVEARGTYASGHTSGITGETMMAQRSLKDRLANAPDAPVAATAVEQGVGFLTVEATEEPADEPTPGTIRPLALVTKQLCFRSNITIQGAGVGEDYWTSNSLLITANGQEFWGLSPSSVWTQFKTDDAGCAVSQQLETGAWTFRAYSMGQLNAGSPIVINVFNSTDGLPWAVDFPITITNSTAVQTLTYTAIDQIETFHIARATLKANASALTSRTLGHTLSITANASATNGTNLGINVTNADDNKKWDVSHEVGHWVEFNETVTHTAMAYNASLAGPPPLCAQGASHHIGSREFTSAAHTEGFASFFSASTFNNKAETSCRTFFSGTTIDCEGTTTHADSFMETQCNDGSSFAGHGNETDWQKMFWDLVKPWTTTQTTVRQILDFVNTADAPAGTNWSATNHYTLFNTASNAAATPDHLETRWDTFSVSNGIDH